MTMAEKACTRNLFYTAFTGTLLVVPLSRWVCSWSWEWVSARVIEALILSIVCGGTLVTTSSLWFVDRIYKRQLAEEARERKEKQAKERANDPTKRTEYGEYDRSALEAARRRMNTSLSEAATVLDTHLMREKASGVTRPYERAVLEHNHQLSRERYLAVLAEIRSRE